MMKILYVVILSLACYSCVTEKTIVKSIIIDEPQKFTAFSCSTRVQLEDTGDTLNVKCSCRKKKGDIYEVVYFHKSF